MIAYAATIDGFLAKLNDRIINPAIEFAFIVAFVVFLWGAFEFIRGAAKEEQRSAGKRHMFWGIIGFIIMLGVWGIITILLNTFGIEGGTFNQEKQEFRPPETMQELKIN